MSPGTSPVWRMVTSVLRFPSLRGCERSLPPPPFNMLPCHEVRAVTHPLRTLGASAEARNMTGGDTSTTASECRRAAHADKESGKA